MMYVTYKFANFRKVETHEDHVVLESDLSQIQPYPEYITVEVA
jgi:hypothetical protein